MKGIKVWLLDKGPYPSDVLFLFSKHRETVNHFFKTKFRMINVIPNPCKGFAGWIDGPKDAPRFYFFWLSEFNRHDSFDYMVLAHELTHTVNHMLEHLGVADLNYEAHAYLLGWLFQQSLELLWKGKTSNGRKPKRTRATKNIVPGLPLVSSPSVLPNVGSSDNK